MNNKTDKNKKTKIKNNNNDDGNNTDAAERVLEKREQLKLRTKRLARQKEALAVIRGESGDNYVIKEKFKKLKRLNEET